jgi:hypothetical protein
MSLLAQLKASSTGEGGQRTAADVAPAAFLYFGAAAAMIGLCLVCFSMLTRLKYSRAKLGPYLASECALQSFLCISYLLKQPMWSPP